MGQRVPRVDVIVPCYNYGRFLRQCVDSVLSQAGVAVRVLIIDDCSADDSEAVGRHLAAEDSRVEYRRHAVNRGHVATYNEGLDWIGGDYCLLLSADDLLVPGALARAAAVLETHPEVGLTHGKAIWTSDPGSPAHVLDCSGEATIQTGLEFIYSRCRVGQNLVETPTAVGRTAVQKEVGHYRPELPHTCDLDMWLRFAARAAVAFVPAHQAFYRTHGQNMSVGFRGVADLRQLERAFDAFFAGPGGSLPGAAALRRAARRGITDQAFDAAYHAFATDDRRVCGEYSRYAAALEPVSQFAPRWIRLRAKRFFGPRLIRGARACRQWLGRRPAVS